jgi:hypothetical protein
MPSHKDSFIIPIPIEQAMMICKEAVAATNWRVLEQGESHLKCKEVVTQATSFNWPAEVSIDLKSIEKGTAVVMNGGISGWGPIQSSHLQGQMGNLRNRMELAFQKLQESHKQVHTRQNELSLVSELERLANLRANGALTEEEFQQAKKKLLGP